MSSLWLLHSVVAKAWEWMPLIAGCCLTQYLPTTTKAFRFSELSSLWCCRYGQRSWKPWLLSLLVDIASSHLSNAGAKVAQRRIRADDVKPGLSTSGGMLLLCSLEAFRYVCTLVHMPAAVTCLVKSILVFQVFFCVLVHMACCSQCVWTPVETASGFSALRCCEAVVHYRMLPHSISDWPLSHGSLTALPG